MLFGNDKCSIVDFLPRVLAHIDGISTDMVQTYVMDAVIQFLRDTKLLTEIICVVPSECVFSYKLNTSYYINEVLNVRMFSNGRQIATQKIPYRINNNTLYLDENILYPPSFMLEVELSVAPYRDSEEVPGFLYEEWIDAITSLTLAKLYLLTDNEWYSPQAANNHMSIYQNLTRQARFSKITKHKAFSMRLSNMRRL